MIGGIELSVRICHITCVHPRHDIRILTKECRSLAKAGYETYLVVCDDALDEEVDGVHIVSTGYHPKNRRQRLLYAAKRSCKKAIEVNASVYHLHDPELLSIAGRLLKSGAKVIFDAHEDYEEQIMGKYWIPFILRKPISYVYGVYSRVIIRRLSGIITVTPSFVEKFRRYNEKVELVTNYPIQDEAVLETADDNKAVNNTIKEKYIFFAGGISKQWCHETIVKAIRKVPDIQYLFAGIVSDIDLNNIVEEGEAHYLGVLSHKEVMRYYQDAIAGIAIADSPQTNGLGTLGNTKLFEIMQAGKPVICSDLTIWKQIVELHNCGICVNCHNIDGIADAVLYISSHPEEAEIMGRNGRRAVVEEYNWNTQEKALIDFYKGITMTSQ